MTDLAPHAAKPEAWRRTPPAVFPSIFGLLGLGLAWRTGREALPFDVPGTVIDAYLYAVCVIFLYCFASYLAKLSARPKVMIEDMSSVPGRAGTSAISLSILLFAAVMAPLSISVAQAALFMGLALHCIVALLAVFLILRSPQGRRVTPVWHLNFVGFILAPLSAIPMGYDTLAVLIMQGTVPAAAVIYLLSALQLSQSEMPLAQRPLLVVHLAPVSLFTTVSAMLGWHLASYVFGTLAFALGCVILLRLRTLAAGGFSPLWGAFTFPIAALATAMFMLGTQISTFGTIALVPLTVVSLIAPYVALRVLYMWMRGTLATTTGAAIA